MSDADTLTNTSAMLSISKTAYEIIQFN